MDAAPAFKKQQGSAEAVQVYEKIRGGIWVYSGLFHLLDAWQEPSNGRQVCKFRLELADDQLIPAGEEPRAEQTRVIPSHVMLEVWKRDSGKCITRGGWLVAALVDQHAAALLYAVLVGRARSHAHEYDTRPAAGREVHPSLQVHAGVLTHLQVREGPRLGQWMGYWSPQGDRMRLAAPGRRSQCQPSVSSLFRTLWQHRGRREGSHDHSHAGDSRSKSFSRPQDQDDTRRAAG